MPLRRVAGREVSAVSGSKAASADTAVRSTSMGCAVLMHAMISRTGAGRRRAAFSSVEKVSHLCARRQFAVQQEIGCFLEGGVLRQIVDGIAAVAQFAGFAVDESRGRTLEVDVLEAPVDLGCRLRRVHDERLLLDRIRSPCYEAPDSTAKRYRVGRPREQHGGRAGPSPRGDPTRERGRAHPARGRAVMAIGPRPADPGRRGGAGAPACGCSSAWISLRVQCAIPRAMRPSAPMLRSWRPYVRS